MKLTSKDYFFVSVQAILFIVYVFDFFPKLKIPVHISYAGILFAAVGILIAVSAVLKLDRNLTPFPTPKDGTQLITSGWYRFSRHPIYTGIMMFVFGYALFRMSVFKLLVSVCLLILFWFKTNYEEHQLRKKFPEYNDYQKRTGRFFPKIK